MKLTNEQIHSIVNQVQEIAPEIDEKFTTKMKWIYRLNIKKLDDVHNEFLKMSNEIDSKYSSDDKSEEKDEEIDGNIQKIRVVKKEFLDSFVKEKQDLANITNEIDITKIKDSELFEIKDISFKLLNGIDFMVDIS